MKISRQLAPILITLTAVLIISSCMGPGGNWTHFRGSHLDGKADVEHAPLFWNPDSGIIWKTAIHDRGWSSPVVYEDQIWMTTAAADGSHMYAVCVDFHSGEILHDILLFTPDSVFRIHAINSYATPTPCIDNGFVYVHFGRYGTVCISTADGSTVWERTDLPFDDIQGPGSSPVIYKNMLILHCEGVDAQYILALDKSNGKTIWRTDRPAELYEPMFYIGRKAYTTAFIITVKGRDLLISNGSAVCIAYDVKTGQEVWRVIQGEDSTIAMPFYEDGIIYFFTSFIQPEEGERYAELLAVNPDGEGDITGTGVLWRKQVPILQLLTPVIEDGLIYTVDSKNVLMCLDAKTGAELKSERLAGKYNASPILAAGHLYFCSTRGETSVFKEGKELEIVATNKLEGEIWTTPAILRNNILIRTSEYLYLIGK